MQGRWLPHRRLHVVPDLFLLKESEADVMEQTGARRLPQAQLAMRPFQTPAPRANVKALDVTPLLGKM